MSDVFWTGFGVGVFIGVGAILISPLTGLQAVKDCAREHNVYTCNWVLVPELEKTK